MCVCLSVCECVSVDCAGVSASFRKESVSFLQPLNCLTISLLPNTLILLCVCESAHVPVRVCPERPCVCTESRFLLS